MSFSIRTRIFAVLVCLCALGASPAHAAPPDTLTLADLVNRADRWPPSVTVTHSMNFAGGHRVAQGQTARVLGVTDNAVQADAGQGLLVQLSLSDCDLLDAANRAWAQLTPAQRAVDPESLHQDVSLWPAQVQNLSALHPQNGAVIPGGTDFDLVSVDEGEVRLLDPSAHVLYRLPEGATDVFARARALALLDPAHRPSRVADALRDVLVGADGSPHRSRALDDSQVFVLYYGASWCPPCRQFTPGFSQYIKHAEAANPHMSVAMISDDKDEAKMREYMTEEAMPFPAVPFSAWTKSPLLTGYLKKSIPMVVVLDRYGRVIAENYAGDQYLDPNTAVQALSGLLASGAAR